MIITDHEYPVRPAFSLLTKVLDDFTAKIPQTSFSNPSAISFPELNTYLQKYQDPRQADAIMRVQQELDETKIVLVCVLFEFRMCKCQYGPRPFFLCSTRRSSLSWSVVRNLTTSSTAQMRCRLKARCSTRRQRRYVHVRLPCVSYLDVLRLLLQQNSCCVVM